jgi:hypothetical protein
MIGIWLQPSDINEIENLKILNVTTLRFFFLENSEKL